MTKLKKIIFSMHQNDFDTIEKSLLKTNADNFLFLLRSYRGGNLSDETIISSLGVNTNSFYVLKSRLYDKIQETLSGDTFSSKEDIIKLLHQIPEMCYNNSREVANAFLEKLEKDLLTFDMHNELIVVYSAFKKINLHTQKYFHYSQLFNKHIAFSLSLEKSDEILGNFNRVLGQYQFSRSQKFYDTLLFLRKEIGDHFTLNPSRQVEIIRNIIDLSLVLFCHADLSKEFNTNEKLQKTQNLINDLPPSISGSSFGPALDFLHFEYFLQNNQTKSALQYFEKVNSCKRVLLLYSNYFPAAIFLFSKLSFIQSQGRIEELVKENSNELLYDVNDMYTAVMLGIYQSVVAYYAGNFKEAAAKLNELINTNSFKDYFHIGTDIKLTLAYIYLSINEHELADNILKNIYRKIKAEKLDNYANVLHLLKVFGDEIKQGKHKLTDKQKDSFALFLARNNNESKLLVHLLHELKNKYQ